MEISELSGGNIIIWGDLYGHSDLKIMISSASHE